MKRIKVLVQNDQNQGYNNNQKYFFHLTTQDETLDKILTQLEVPIE